MASERSRVSDLATWTGGQLKAVKALTSTLRTKTVAAQVPKFYVDSTVTTTGGAISFTIPSGTFTTIFAADLIIVRDTATATGASLATVRTRTATLVTGQAWESKSTGVLVLNTMVEGLEACGAGVAVDLVAIGI